VHSRASIKFAVAGERRLGTGAVGLVGALAVESVGTVGGVTVEGASLNTVDTSTPAGGVSHPVVCFASVSVAPGDKLGGLLVFAQRRVDDGGQGTVAFAAVDNSPHLTHHASVTVAGGGALVPATRMPLGGGDAGVCVASSGVGNFRGANAIPSVASGAGNCAFHNAATACFVARAPGTSFPECTTTRASGSVAVG